MSLQMVMSPVHSSLISSLLAYYFAWSDLNLVDSKYWISVIFCDFCRKMLHNKCDMFCKYMSFLAWISVQG